MSEEQTNTSGGVFRAGLWLLGAIMLASFGVSFTHVRELFVVNGADIYSASVLAVVVELLFSGSSLEIVRRHRAVEAIWPPVLTLLLGVGMTLWGNLATARHAPGALLAAAFAPAATILTVIVIKTAWTAATDRKAAAEHERSAAEEAAARREAVRTARAARQDTRPVTRPALEATGQDSTGAELSGAEPAELSGRQDPRSVAEIVGGAPQNDERPDGRPALYAVGGRATQLPSGVLDDLLSEKPKKTQKEVAEENSITERTVRRIVKQERERRDSAARPELRATGESSG